MQTAFVALVILHGVLGQNVATIWVGGSGVTLQGLSGLNDQCQRESGSPSARAFVCSGNTDWSQILNGMDLFTKQNNYLGKNVFADGKLKTQIRDWQGAVVNAELVTGCDSVGRPKDTCNDWHGGGPVQTGASASTDQGQWLSANTIGCPASVKYYCINLPASNRATLWISALDGAPDGGVGRLDTQCQEESHSPTAQAMVCTDTRKWGQLLRGMDLYTSPNVFLGNDVFANPVGGTLASSIAFFSGEVSPTSVSVATGCDEFGMPKNTCTNWEQNPADLANADAGSLLERADGKWFAGHSRSCSDKLAFYCIQMPSGSQATLWLSGTKRLPGEDLNALNQHCRTESDSPSAQAMVCAQGTDWGRILQKQSVYTRQNIFLGFDIFASTAPLAAPIALWTGAVKGAQVATGCVPVGSMITPQNCDGWVSDKGGDSANLADSHELADQKWWFSSAGVLPCDQAMDFYCVQLASTIAQQVTVWGASVLGNSGNGVQALDAVCRKESLSGAARAMVCTDTTDWGHLLKGVDLYTRQYTKIGTDVFASPSLSSPITNWLGAEYPPGRFMVSGCGLDGEPKDHCHNWKDPGTATAGLSGELPDRKWFYGAADIDCQQSFNFYCILQPSTQVATVWVSQTTVDPSGSLGALNELCRQESASESAQALVCTQDVSWQDTLQGLDLQTRQSSHVARDIFVNPYLDVPFNDWNGDVVPSMTPIATGCDKFGLTDVNCGDWKDPQGTTTFGTPGGQDGTWVAGGADLCGSGRYRIYCIQMPSEPVTIFVDQAEYYPPKAIVDLDGVCDHALAGSQVLMCQPGLDWGTVLQGQYLVNSNNKTLGPNAFHGALLNPILDIARNYVPEDQFIATACSADGYYKSGESCRGLTSGDGQDSLIGGKGNSTFDWLQQDGSQACNKPFRIYCVRLPQVVTPAPTVPYTPFPTPLPTFPPTPIPTPTPPPTSLPTTATSLPTTLAPSNLPTRTPTTLAPTTLAPTTLTPTTAPTTLAPTTRTPTTLAPTTLTPTTAPTTRAPSFAPTVAPTTLAPTRAPTTLAPTTLAPTTLAPTTLTPTLAPTTRAPTLDPTVAPTTRVPTTAPTLAPTLAPSTIAPSQQPTTRQPTVLGQTFSPSRAPTQTPTAQPTPPTSQPTTQPTEQPTTRPTTTAPTGIPTKVPSQRPTTKQPSTRSPTPPTTSAPTPSPTTQGPTLSPTTRVPTSTPTLAPTTDAPTEAPTTQRPTTVPVVIVIQNFTGNVTQNVTVPGHGADVFVVLPFTLFNSSNSSATVVIGKALFGDHESSGNGNNNPGGDSVVSIDVVVDGQVVDVMDLGIPVELTIPRVLPKCAAQAEAPAQCVWWDTKHKIWRTDNCTSSPVTLEGGVLATKCSCNHLTDFAVLLDQTEPCSSPQSTEEYLPFAVIYALIFLYCICYLVRLLLVKDSASFLRWQHALIGMVALLRFLSSLRFFGVLGDNLIFEAFITASPYLLEFWIFTRLASTWIGLVSFTMQTSDARWHKIRPVLYGVNVVGSCFVIALFVAFVIELNYTAALTGTIGIATIYVLLSGTFLYYSGRLVKTMTTSSSGLKRGASSNSVTGAKPNRCACTASTKILAAGRVAALCFAMQALCSVLALLVAKTALIIFTTLFLFFNCAALACLLLVYRAALLKALQPKLLTSSSRDLAPGASMKNLHAEKNLRSQSSQIELQQRDSSVRPSVLESNSSMIRKEFDDASG